MGIVRVWGIVGNEERPRYDREERGRGVFPGDTQNGVCVYSDVRGRRNDDLDGVRGSDDCGQHRSAWEEIAKKREAVSLDLIRHPVIYTILRARKEGKEMTHDG